MQKAFSLLELLIVIATISIILTFAIPKFNDITNTSKITELKSNIALIRNGITKFKTNQILLAQPSNISTLDSAIVDKNNESLFKKVIDFSITSTSSSINEIGKWIKTSQSSYEYVLSSSKKVLFSLEDNNFKCKSSFEICKEIE
jgi:prepilin-type N-terminal cleavage/methylation domain-containing protein